MKTRITTFSILVILFLTINLNAQTTEEEYNFITKGYKVQLESGLDMKKGYVLKDLGTHSLNFGSEGTREAEFKGLYKTVDNKLCAIMLIYRRPSTNYVEYFCIPSSDAPQSIWNRTLEQINSHWTDLNSKSIYSTLVWALMKFGSERTTK